MKRNINVTKEKDVAAKRLMGPDQPFDYQEVATKTGPEYARYMNRDGLVCVPYEDVKKNIPGFYLPEDKCVWMRAGVINYRLCDYDYNCYHCPFDQAMTNAMDDKAVLQRNKMAVNWIKHVKTKYQMSSTPCIHFLSGRISSPEECSNNYMCRDCDVHELLHKESPVEPTQKPGYKNVSGYKMIEDYFYHFGHLWVNIEKFRRVRVGMDDFISKILGPADEINLPPVGTPIKRGETGCILSRNNKKAPMQSPISGTVYSVNDKLKNNPKLANDDPFHEGWLYILDPENLEPELAGLYSGKEFFQWMEKESQNLYHLMGPRYEQLAATGGEPIGDIYGHFPEMDWDRLVSTFLYMAENR